MNKPLPIALALSVLLISSAGLSEFEVAQANFFVGPWLVVESPTDWKVYTNTTIPLSFSALVRNGSTEVVRFLYSLDGASNVTLTDLTRENDVGGYTFRVTGVLKDLMEGNHTITVYSQDHAGTEMSASKEFMIDTQFKNPITLLSPQNITYTVDGSNKTDVALTFASTEKINWVLYLLDDFNSAPVKDGRITGNITLTDLPIGNHKVTVTVGTVRGPYSLTVEFNVAEPEPFPFATVAAAVLVALAIAGGILLVYFKKRPRNLRQPHA
ncbi:MAG: hypothetical protein NWE93_01310 [Candidatus Bathyarchaeota archaeon]|nr:hypothetical protein [Candidatus Bathyarchaeota archaeon]